MSWYLYGSKPSPELAAKRPRLCIGVVEGASAWAVATDADTWYDLVGTFDTHVDDDFTATNAGIVTYTGIVDIKFNVDVAISAEADRVSIVHYAVFKNDTEKLPHSEIERSISSPNQVGAVSIVACAELTQGDTLQVKVSKEGGPAVNISNEHISIRVS